MIASLAGAAPCAPTTAHGHDRRRAAKLDFTLKDMNGRTSSWPTSRAARSSSTSGRPGAGPASPRSRCSSSSSEKYKDQKFTVLGISTDDTPEDLRQFAAEYKMNYPVLVGLGNDELLEAYDAVDRDSGDLVHPAPTAPCSSSTGARHARSGSRRRSRRCCRPRARRRNDAAPINATLACGCQRRVPRRASTGSPVTVVIARKAAGCAHRAATSPACPSTTTAKRCGRPRGTRPPLQPDFEDS